MSRKYLAYYVVSENQTGIDQDYRRITISTNTVGPDGLLVPLCADHVFPHGAAEDGRREQATAYST
jgi:hypothetical protein